MTESRQPMFSERYANGNMPWDSGITPPEIQEILASAPPGRALDLGCGTGTVMRDLLRAGWQADGVDFVPRAIALAEANHVDDGAKMLLFEFADGADFGQGRRDERSVRAFLAEFGLVQQLARFAQAVDMGLQAGGGAR